MLVVQSVGCVHVHVQGSCCMKIRRNCTRPVVVNLRKLNHPDAGNTFSSCRIFLPVLSQAQRAPSCELEVFCFLSYFCIFSPAFLCALDLVSTDSAFLSPPLPFVFCIIRDALLRGFYCCCCRCCCSSLQVSRGEGVGELGGACF